MAKTKKSAPAPSETSPKPERYDRARIRLIPNLNVDRSRIVGVGQWLDARKDELVPYSVGPENPESVQGYFWENPNIDLLWPNASAIREAVVAELETTAMALGLDGSFDGALTMTAKMFHHSGYHWWHVPDKTAWLGYRIFMHSHPKRYSGGEVEFTDGTTVEPIGGSCLFFDPKQAQRTKPVDCWTPNLQDGRWTIEGMIYPAAKA
jgi:hypothetical protein